MAERSDFRIYIVEDDDAVRDSLRELLSLLYLNVRAFESGLEFLRNVADFRNACLVLDIQLPVQDGWQILKELRRRRIRLPTILITAMVEASYFKKARSFGVIALLEKPLAHHNLISAIEAARRSR